MTVKKNKTCTIQNVLIMFIIKHLGNNLLFSISKVVYKRLSFSLINLYILSLEKKKDIKLDDYYT